MPSCGMPGTGLARTEENKNIGLRAVANTFFRWIQRRRQEPSYLRIQGVARALADDAGE